MTFRTIKVTAPALTWKPFFTMVLAPSTEKASEGCFLRVWDKVITLTSRYDKGKQAEDLAAEFLLQQGIKVLARNFRCALGEIDLIGNHNGSLVFVEVKSRLGKAHGLPQEAVSREKQRRLTRLAQWYIKQNRLEKHSARFDVIAITWQDREPKITWIANAFEASE